MVLPVLLAGCDRGPDIAQANACAAVLPAFFDDRDFTSSTADPDGMGVALSNSTGHRLACRFEGDRQSRNRLAIASVAVDGRRLSDREMAVLTMWMRLPGEALRMAEEPVMGDGEYFLRQAANGLVAGCFYALLATGYAMIYGLLGIVNFAFGELFMLGAFAAAGLTTSTELLGGTGLAASLVALVGSMLLLLPWGWAVERFAYRPLRKRTEILPSLVVAVGLSIFLQELARISQGSRAHWLPPLLEQPQFLVVGATALACAGVWWVVNRTHFGRQQRALVDDRAMAALVGVDIDRTIARSFMLAAALAGLAGALSAISHGAAEFAMGNAVGLKALTATVLGGMGSIGGAMLGGFLVGMVEVMIAAYDPGIWPDIMIYVLLVIAIVVSRSRRTQTV